MIHALCLTGLNLALSHQHWLFAKTCSLLGGTGLIVYRSVLVRDTDPVYAPVAEFLSKCRVEILAQKVFPDPSMMFGQGEFTAYLLITAPSSSDPLEGIDPGVVEDLRIEGLRILHELTGVAIG